MSSRPELTTVQATRAAPSAASRVRKVLRWARRAWVPLALVAASLAMSISVTVQHSEQFSPLDEWVYYDYVVKIPTQFVVRQGEDISEPALQAMACNGDSFGPRGEPCTGKDGVYDEPELYPQEGRTSADIYTPLYFAATWLMAQVVQFFTGLDLLVAARLTGFVWLASGVLALYAVARELRIRKSVAFGLGMIVIGSVTSRYAYTYITTDAPSFVMGAALLLMTLRFLKSKSSGWWLVPLAALAVLFKVTNIFAVGLVALILLIHAIVRLRERPRLPGNPPSPGKILTVTSVMILASVGSEVVWLAIRSAIRVAPQPDQGLGVPLSKTGIAQQLATFLQFETPSALDSALMLPFGLLAIGGVVGLFLASERWGFERSLSIATAVAAIVFAPILLVAMNVVLGSSFPVISRYNASILPAFLLAIGLLARNRTSMTIVSLYGVGLVTVALVRGPTG